MENKNPSNALNIPTAIVIAGAIIAISIIYTKAPAKNDQVKYDQKSSFENQFRSVDSTDYILGNPSSKIKIVEYSDTSCPFCKVFHNTMKKIMNDYGKSGNVAWVYRHYPLDKAMSDGSILHPNAGREAQATECAGALGGNEKFWTYTNRLYEITPSVTSNSPGGLDQKELPKIAKFAGINVEDFNNCLATNKFKEKVESHFLEGVNIGINGTPSNIFVLENKISNTAKEKIMQIFEPFKDASSGEYPISISENGKYIMMGGAMPIEIVKATIDILLLSDQSK